MSGVYQLAPEDGVVIRLADRVFIPPDPRNTDRKQYLAWLALGNIPDLPDPQFAINQAAAALKTLYRAQARADPTIALLTGMSPAAIGTWFDANVNSVPDLRAFCRALAKVVGVLAEDY